MTIAAKDSKTWMNHYHLTLFSSSSSSSGFVFTLDRGTPPWIDPTGVWAWLILTIRVRSVWWDHLFNTVNNKERGRGQRSVVWLKRGQPCLHHLYVLSTAFSWQPLSSFGLWIILLPPSRPALYSSTDWFNWRGGSWLEGAGLPAMGAQLSRGWLCQRWKPLDIPGTHLFGHWVGTSRRLLPLVVLLGWDPWGVYCVSSVYEAFGLASFFIFICICIIFCGVA